MITNFLKGSIYAVLARLMTAASGLLLTVLLPKYLSPEDVGRVYLSITQATLLSIIARFGVDYTINSRILKSEAVNHGNIIISGLITVSFTGICLLFIVFPLSMILGKYHFWPHAATLTWPIVIWGISFAAALYIFQVYKLEGRVFLASLTRGFFQNMAIIFAIILANILYSPLTFPDALPLISIAILIVVTINISHYFSRNLKNAKIDLKLTYEMLRESPKFFYYSVLLFIISDLDIWLISSFLSKTDIAIYATIKRCALLASIMIDLANLVLPKLYKDSLTGRGSFSGVELLSRRLSLAATVMSVLIFFAALFFGRSIINYLWGESYEPGFAVLLIMLLSFALVLSTGFSEIFLILKGDKSILLNSLIYSALIIISLNLFLIPIFGIVGAAWSYLVASVFLRVRLAIYVYIKYNTKLFAGW